MRLFSCRQINRDESSAVDQLDHQLPGVTGTSIPISTAAIEHFIFIKPLSINFSTFSEIDRTELSPVEESHAETF